MWALATRLTHGTVTPRNMSPSPYSPLPVLKKRAMPWRFSSMATARKSLMICSDVFITLANIRQKAENYELFIIKSNKSLNSNVVRGC